MQNGQRWVNRAVQVRQVAGRTAVDMHTLGNTGVATAPHNHDCTIGLDFGNAHNELLSLHLEGVDLVWSSHVDVVADTEYNG